MSFNVMPELIRMIDLLTAEELHQLSHYTYSRYMLIRDEKKKSPKSRTKEISKKSPAEDEKPALKEIDLDMELLDYHLGNPRLNIKKFVNLFYGKDPNKFLFDGGPGAEIFAKNFMFAPVKHLKLTKYFPQNVELFRENFLLPLDALFRNREEKMTESQRAACVRKAFAIVQGRDLSN